MPVDPETLQAIRDRLRIEDVIGQTVELHRSGTSLVGLCPFHDETTPSFTVNPRKQLFHCFGCDTGGDVFTFLQLQSGASFTTVVTDLAKQTDVDLAATNNTRQPHRPDPPVRPHKLYPPHKPVMPARPVLPDRLAGTAPNHTANQAVDNPERKHEMPARQEGVITEVGNLTRPVEIQTDKNGNPWARAQVAVNDHTRDQQGNWNDETTFYQLAVFGDDATQLASTQAQSGNVKVLFSGELTNRQWEADGKRGVSHDVKVRQIGVSLSGQHVSATRPDGRPIGSARETQAAEIAGQQNGLGTPQAMAQTPADPAVVAQAVVTQAAVQAQTMGL